MKTLIIIGLMLFAVQAQAETWTCSNTRTSKTLVTAVILKGRKYGVIKVSGTKYDTSYGVDGFDRRWDFGTKGTSYRYAFIITADDYGRYYDFSSTSKRKKPSLILYCKQSIP